MSAPDDSARRPITWRADERDRRLAGAASSSARVRGLLVMGMMLVACAAAPDPAHAQAAAIAPPANRVVIAALANAISPADLDYQGAECEINEAGTRMECGFQQVFLTMSPLDAQTCLITTNQYSRTFDKQSATRWVSIDGPDGECGLLDVATLEDEGNMIHWSLEMKTVRTRTDLASCKGELPAAEVLSWRNVRRPLPCRFVQPGALRP
jgi:hypothetical protein